MQINKKVLNVFYLVIFVEDIYRSLSPNDHAVDIDWRFDTRQRQQHIAFNRHLDGTK